MIQRKTVLISSILAFALPILSMKWNDTYKILSDEDIKMEHDQTDPALSSATYEETQWKSFDRWRCFHSDEVEIRCAEVCWKSDSCVSGGWERQPFISVLHDGHLFEFEDESRSHRPCEEILNDWRAVLDRQVGTCILAAHLQDNDVDPDEGIKKRSVWILSRLKTYIGQWQTEDSLQ